MLHFYAAGADTPLLPLAAIIFFFDAAISDTPDEHKRAAADDMLP